MTTAMSAHQEPPRERLGPPSTQSWQPKRNKRKDFKPRCAPVEDLITDTANLHDNPITAYSPNSRHEDDEEEDLRTEDGEENEAPHPKRMYKGSETVVDLSGRRLSTDSNENIESNDYRQNSVLSLLEQQKRLDALRSLSVSSQFQQSYIQSLQLGQNVNKDPSITTPSGEYKTKNFSTKSPFAISQLIKTNSPTRRRVHSNNSDMEDDDSSVKNDENGSHDNDGSGDDNNRDKDEAMDVDDGEEEMLNGEAPANNRMLTDYAVNTMKELLGIYGLSSNEVAEALSGQAGKHYPLWLQRRWTQGALGPLGPLGMMAAPFPEDSNPVSPLDAQKANSVQDDSGSGMDSDGERTLDLSVSKDNDVQDLSTTSSAGNSVTDFEQQSLLMRRNLEDLAGLHGIFSKPQSSMDNDDSSSDMRAKLSPAALLASLNQLDGRRQSSIPTLDYSRYVKRFSSALECGSSYCKDLGYREHFHCLDCSGRVFCKKEEMIRHFKWHKKRDESLAHGFMRYSPLDDCGERGPGCPHNRSQTHYHCIQDGCDKVYISTSDVQMHANYHRKDSAILQEGFQRFRATERCSAPHCAFRGQRTTHFHCRRPHCLYTFKNKADMEKHKTYHIKDEQLARDGFKKYMKNEPCPYRDCRFSRMCNHIHCIRPRCNYVLHSSSQLFSHKRKHERKDQEMTYGIPSGLPNAMYQSPEDSPLKGKLQGSMSPQQEGDDSSMGASYPTSSATPLLPIQSDEEHPLNQLVMDELTRKYIHTFNGGTDPDDKCHKCSAFNKHYHCLVEECGMAHSCQSTMMKHALEHEHQNQVTEAYFQTFTKTNPCPSTSCHHIREQTHYHCTWENCGCVILPSEDQPFRRLEHHRQHALLSPLSPNLGRLAQALNPNPLQALAPNLPHSLVPNPFQNFAPSALQNIPPNILQTLPPSILQTLSPSVLQNLSPSLLQNLNPTLLQSLNSSALSNLSPSVLQTQGQGHAGPASSLDEMFSRKRGRPPKNRVVEVWADHATPQAIFTSFKLPKSNQSSSLPPSPSEFSKIKFHHFDAYMTPDACASSHPACQIRSSRVHVHCSHCAYTTEDHASLEVHCRETHSVSKLLDNFEYYQSCVDCNVSKCIKAQLRGHFHCNALNCSSVVTQYSALLGHKHRTMDDDVLLEMGRKAEEVRDYSMKARDVVASLEGFHGTNLSVKSENADDSLNTSVSVVKAAGTFYPLSGASPSPTQQQTQTQGRLSSSSSNNSNSCQLCLARPSEQQDLPCTHNLTANIVISNNNNNASTPPGLAATKETLEREYPEISILPSTACPPSPAPSPSVQRHSHSQTSAQDGHTTPTSSQPSSSSSRGTSSAQVDSPQAPPLSQAVHSLLLHQYLAQASGKPPTIPDHLKYHQQMAFLRSPFPLYPGMMYPPELLMEQSALLGSSSSALAASLAQEKEAEMAAKRVHPMRGAPNMRMLKDEPIPEGYLRFRFNEDCAYQHCGYREHQTHFHCTRRDCGYSFCDKTRFVQHTARHERLDTLMGGDFQQYRANVFCGRQDCAHASNFGNTQNKASHFHCLKCEFVCTDTNKVVAHRRQHQKMDSIQAAGFDKFPPSKGCGFDPQCIHSKKQTHYHCLQCGFAVLGLSQMTSHKYRHQETSGQQGAGTSNNS